MTTKKKIIHPLVTIIVIDWDLAINFTLPCDLMLVFYALFSIVTLSKQTKDQVPIVPANHKIKI